jgi:hypothetical protein
MRGYKHFLRNLKYVILVYDIHNSPIRGKYTDLGERKFQAAKLAGFRLTANGRFKKEDENILYGKDDDVNRMIVRYIIIQNSPDIIAFSAYNELLATEMQQSLDAGSFSPQERRVIRESIATLTEKLSVLYNNIFSEEESNKLRMALYRTVEEDKISLRPEDIAKDIEEKKFSPKVDPYNVFSQ